MSVLTAARRGAILTLVVARAAAAQVVPAQEAPRARVAVRQVAGASVYVDLGTRGGLATGDTLPALRDGAAAPAGALVVTAAGEARAVLAFAGPPFTVAAGDTLTLLLRRAPPAAAAEAADPPRPAPAPTPAPDARAVAPLGSAAPPPRATATPARAEAPHGSMALELAAGQHTTVFGGADPVELARRSASPALRADATIPGLAGGLRLRVGGRLAYRYEDHAVAAPATSLRFYAAALERDVPGSALQLSLGRFHSPDESFSGFWDGARVRYGREVGVGVLVGFQPDLWNERPSLDRPQATLVLDGRRRGAGWRWSGDASAHWVAGLDARPAHAFVGLSQDLALGRLRLGHDVQVDRHAAGAWGVSRAAVRGGITLGPALELRAGYARRATYLEHAEAPFLAPARDRVTAGLAATAGGVRVSADVARAHDPAGESTSYSGSLSAPLAPRGALWLDASASYWVGPYGTSLSGAPALGLALGPTRLRAGYRYDRTDFLDRALVTHGADLSWDLPLGGGARALLHVRGQRGSAVRSVLVDATLSRFF